MTTDTKVLAEVEKARQEEREACARLIETHQESLSTSNGFYLSPRSHGNRTGLSFAAAIRKRGVNSLNGERRLLRAMLESLVKGMDDLIVSSEGVTGLHRNGDVAPWDSLTAGGEFEDWLGVLDEARNLLKEIKE